MTEYNYKRGTLLEITEKFGNGEETRTVGYYWCKSKKHNSIVLVSSFPPYRFQNRIQEKRYCNYNLIKKIIVLGGDK